VWTYFYYSYSKPLKRAVGFVFYGPQNPNRVQFDVEHPNTNYLRLIVGGNDANRYPGFNGQFFRISYSNEKGAFVNDFDGLS
jgi:hypothetical protein